MGDIEYRILGSLEALRDGQRLALGGAKQRALLAILLVNANRVVTTDFLVEALWPDKAPGKPLTAIQGYVSALRKVLGKDVIVTEPAGYRLPLESDQLDAFRFETLAHKGRHTEAGPLIAASCFAEALSLFRGTSLADFTYENWARPDIERIDEQRLACLEDRIGADLTLGRHAELVGELEVLVVEYPLRERLRSQLMLALYRSGRQADALNAYQDTRVALVEELGLDPSPELQALHAKILNHDATLAAPDRPTRAQSAMRLPSPATTFVGREKELADVMELVQRTDIRLMTLIGPGGIGKTRLSIRVAEEAASLFEGVYFCALAPLRDGSLVLPAIAQVLDIAEQPPRPLRDVLVDALADTRMLLVLDNAEHLIPSIADDVAFLRDIRNGPTLLVSSRERLNVQAEQLYAIPTLGMDDGIELFGERAGRTNPDVDLADARIPALCKRLDLLPLAIELAAARSDVYSPLELLAALSEPTDLLVGPRDADPRHRTLSSTIAWSYDHLPPVERRMYQALSVFAGAFTGDAAEAVAGAGPAHLNSLADKSFLRRSDGSRGRRFWMLETIREYGLELLERSGASNNAQLRHAEFMQRRVASREQLVKDGDPTTFQELEEDQANLRAVLSWSLDSHAPDVAADLVRVLWRYWADCGHGAEGLAWAVRALEYESLSSEARLDCLLAAGELARTQGDFPGAKYFLEQLAFGDIGTGRELYRAQAVGALTNIAMAEDALDAASELNRQGLEIWRHLGDANGLASALYTSGCLAFFQGRYAEARTTFVETLPHFRETGEHYGEAVSHLMIGQCARRLGNLDESTHELRRGLEMTVASNARAYYPECLQEVAALQLLRRESELAVELLGASARHRAELGTPLWDADDWQATVTAASKAMGDDFDSAWGRGAVLSLEDAVRKALHSLSP